MNIYTFAAVILSAGLAPLLGWWLARKFGIDTAQNIMAYLILGLLIAAVFYLIMVLVRAMRASRK